ncbi:MAG: enolase C-terminal domain-like protein, partial [Blastocatellia bacterium]
GVTGWGEMVAFEEPVYSSETVQTALHAVRDFLGPALFTAPIGSLGEMAARFARFRGHNMARASLELAFADLSARILGQSLSKFLGGTRERVEVGVSLGIQPTVEGLVERVDRYLSLGYRRIKLKIKPGLDIDIVARVRERYPDILLSVDANSAYTLDEIDRLKLLDGFNLLMIEQPLHHDDLVDHAKLQSVIRHFYLP